MVTGFLLGVVSVALFTGFTLVSRVGLMAALRPWDLAFLRFGIGGLVLLPVLLRNGFGGIGLQAAIALAFTGGIGFAACAYAGFALAPATHGAVLLHGTLPLSTYLLVQVRRAQGAPMGGAGLPFIALGVVAMVWEGIARGTPSQWFGDAALLLASLSWSAYGVLMRRTGLRPVHSASIVAVLSMAVSAPLYLATPGTPSHGISWHEWLTQAAFQGVLIGALSIYVYSAALSRLGPERTAVLTALVPCVTSMGAVFLLDETPPSAVWVGIALVTVGMLVSLFRRPTWQRSRAPSRAEKG